MKTCLLIALLLINHRMMAFPHSCNLQPPAGYSVSLANNDDTTKARQISFKLIESSPHSFGYDVFVDGKLTVHQPTMPAVAGHRGFTKKEDAEKVAQLVVSKIKAGVMPPTVTKQEMEKLGVAM